MSSDLNKLKSEKDENVFGKTVAPLTNGLLKIYQPELEKVQLVLKELNEKEATLLNQIHDENLQISQIQHSPELTELFNKIEVYKAKLVNIKKDMKHLHEKSLKLKKRAQRIQQFKEKDKLLQQQKEANLKMEQDLIAKPASTGGPSNTA